MGLEQHRQRGEMRETGWQRNRFPAQPLRRAAAVPAVEYLVQPPQNDAEKPRPGPRNYFAAVSAFGDVLSAEAESAVQDDVEAE